MRLRILSRVLFPARLVLAEQITLTEALDLDGIHRHSDHIREATLAVLEVGDSRQEREEANRKRDRDAPTGPWCAQQRPSEAIDDPRHRIDRVHKAPVFGHRVARIRYRAEEEPQLDHQS